MELEKIYFSATDNLQLVGLLHKGNSKTERVVLAVHGMTSNCLKRRDDILAEEFSKNGIDYFTFNNRGSDIMTYFDIVTENKLTTRIESGTSYEKFEDSYEDIKGAILMLLGKGYKEIYLQGHSYGSSKVVYTYNKLKANGESELLEHIKAVTLLSIVDIVRMCISMLGEKYNYIVSEVKQMVADGKGDELIKREYFLHPISAKNFLKFTEKGGIIDIVPFGEPTPDLKAISNIACPIAMLWGGDGDLVYQKPEELEKIIRDNVPSNVNDRLKIKFIDGTGHNYRGKEKELADYLLQTGHFKIS